MVIHLGANIQDNDSPPPEDEFGFRIYSFTCGEEIHRFKTENSKVAEYKGICGNARPDRSISREYPTRCTTCNNEKRRWERRRNWFRRICDRFDWRRHGFMKFVTVGLPGEKIFQEPEPRSELPKDQSTLSKQKFPYEPGHYRPELIRGLKALRKTDFWNEHVDGGMWFYEETIREELNGLQNQRTLHSDAFYDANVTIHLNPHMHILLLGPKKIPYDQLQEEAAKVGLGKFKFSSPRNKYGQYVYPTIKNAVWYVMSYLKKDTQIDARCRGTFGCLYGDKT